MDSFTLIYKELHKYRFIVTHKTTHTFNSWRHLSPIDYCINNLFNEYAAHVISIKYLIDLAIEKDAPWLKLNVCIAHFAGKTTYQFRN